MSSIKRELLEMVNEINVTAAEGTLFDEDVYDDDMYDDMIPALGLFKWPICFVNNTLLRKNMWAGPLHVQVTNFAYNSITAYVAADEQGTEDDLVVHVSVVLESAELSIRHEPEYPMTDEQAHAVIRDCAPRVASHIAERIKDFLTRLVDGSATFDVFAYNDDDDDWRMPFRSDMTVSVVSRAPGLAPDAPLRDVLAAQLPRIGTCIRSFTLRNADDAVVREDTGEKIEGIDSRYVLTNDTDEETDAPGSPDVPEP